MVFYDIALLTENPCVVGSIPTGTTIRKLTETLVSVIFLHFCAFLGEK